MRGQKYRKATLFRADGVVYAAKSLGLNASAKLTTPSAALRWLRIFLLMPHPPLLFKEGNILARQFIHTCNENTARRSEQGEACMCLHGVITTGLPVPSTR
jgi:hypothetical protein